MDLARIGSLCLLLGVPRIVAADVAPLPPIESAQEKKAREEAAAKKIATCSPGREESAGPRGTLITYRSVEYDVIVGEATVTPPEARPPLRVWVRHFSKAIRPCLPKDAELRSPERLPSKLSIVLSKTQAGTHVTSAVALSADRRVDAKCIEAVVLKQEAPPLPVALARLVVDVTLAPFCAITHELQRGDEPAEPYSTGFGPRKIRHLMPAAPPPR
jgi:hypothetical protein